MFNSQNLSSIKKTPLTLVIKWHVVWLLEWKLGKSTQPLAHPTLSGLSCPAVLALSSLGPRLVLHAQFAPTPHPPPPRHSQLHMRGLQASSPCTWPNESPWNHSFPTHSNHDTWSTYCASGPVLGAGAVKSKNKPWSLPLRSSQSSGRDEYKQQLQNSVIKATVDIIAASFRRQRGRLNLGRGHTSRTLNPELVFASYQEGKRYSKPGKQLIHKSIGVSREEARPPLSDFSL